MAIKKITPRLCGAILAIICEPAWSSPVGSGSPPSLLREPELSSESRSNPPSKSMPTHSSLQQESKEATKVASKIMPDESILLIKKIQALREKKELNKAIELGRNYLKTNPNNSDILLLLGLMFYQKKDYFQAELYLNKVLVITPRYLDATLALIRIKIIQKKYLEAISSLNKVIAKNPGNSAVAELYVFYKKAYQSFTATKRKFQADVSKPKSKLKSQYISEVVAHYLKRNKLEEAKHIAVTHLFKNPQDADVRFKLGKIYYQQKQYQLAKTEFDTILMEYPEHRDARLALIDTEFAMKHDSKAKLMIKQGLSIDPNNSSLLAKKANLFFLQRKFAVAADLSNKIILLDPKNAEAKDILSRVKEINPHFLHGLNEIGMLSQSSYVSDQKAWWNYSSVYYRRDTEAGPITLLINQARRFGIKGTQVELDFSPIINRNIYFDLSAAYANKPEIFPKYKFGAEGHLSNYLPVNLSLGSTYNFVTEGIKFTANTLSISKEINKNWISFRPYYYRPNRGEKSVLYTTTARHYFNTYDHYINLTIGFGKSPDLADLLATGFITIKNQSVALDYQFPILNHQLLVDLGLGYTQWDYPNGLQRKLYGLNISLNYRF